MRKLSTEPAVTPTVLSVKNSAIYSGVSRATINKLLSSGQLPSIKLGKRRLIRKSDLDALLNSAGGAA